MSNNVICPYCGELVNQPTSELEHVIPEGIGSPILNPDVCNVCNTQASGKVDSPYLNNLAIRILAVVTGTKTKKGPLEPIKINTKFNENVQLCVEKSKFSFIGTLSAKSEIKLFKKHQDSDFPAVEAALKEDVCRYEHAKLFLGLLSMCVPNFVTSDTAKELRRIMWHGTRPKLNLPEGAHINGRLFGEVQKNVTDKDGPLLYKNRNHIIRIKGEKDGNLFAYINIYNTLRPNIFTTEKREEWKGVDVTIHIDPEVKDVVYYNGITKVDLTQTYPKYKNGCSLKI